MNLDKRAEVIAGFTSTHIMAIAGGGIVALIITFLIIMLTNFLIGFVFFAFAFSTVVIIVKLSQNLPDGYYMNWFESRNAPRYYMPGDHNDTD